MPTKYGTSARGGNRGPGKFDYDLDAAIYELSLEGGPDEEAGSATEAPGLWVGLMTDGQGMAERISKHPDEFPDVTNDDIEFLENEGKAGAIITVNDQGFVGVTYYGKKSDLDHDWAEMVKFVEVEDEDLEPNARRGKRSHRRNTSIADRRKAGVIEGLTKAEMDSMEIRIPTFDWKQVGGDMDPGAHGGTIATADGDTIEIIEIQPVRSHVGDREAKDVGFPFWSKEASYSLDDLSLSNEDVQGAIEYTGLGEHLVDLTPEQRAVAIAEACIQAGVGYNEGPGGWAEDVLGSRIVEWHSGKKEGYEYIADEDDEFRREVLGERYEVVKDGEHEEWFDDSGSDDAIEAAQELAKDGGHVEVKDSFDGEVVWDSEWQLYEGDAVTVSSHKAKAGRSLDYPRFSGTMMEDAIIEDADERVASAVSVKRDDTGEEEVVYTFSIEKKNGSLTPNRSPGVDRQRVQRALSRAKGAATRRDQPFERRAAADAAARAEALNDRERRVMFTAFYAEEPSVMVRNASGTFSSVQAIKAANKRAGGHFFDADTIRFWNSEIEPKVYGGKYFVTSEQFSEGDARRFSVREADATGKVRTVAHNLLDRAEAVGRITDLLASHTPNVRRWPELMEGNDVMSGILDEAARSMDPTGRGIVPQEVSGELSYTDDLIRVVFEYEGALYKALQDAVNEYPPKDDATADDIFAAEAPYLVLMTLRGEGVGIWDGDWDHFWSRDDLEKVQKLLEQKLGRYADRSGSGRINEELEAVVYEAMREAGYGLNDEGYVPLEEGEEVGYEFKDTVLSPERVEEIVSANGIPLERFWEQAGGKKSLTRGDVDRAVSALGGKYAKNKSDDRRFNVFLNGELLEPVYLPASMTAADVKQKLIREQGYDERIVVDAIPERRSHMPPHYRTHTMRQNRAWSGAEKNDLPDSAFLYIEPGGREDESGRTVPRSLRHFPYKDQSGKVDVRHLRNALSRIPQAHVPEAAKRAARTHAEKLLAEHGGYR